MKSIKLKDYDLSMGTIIDLEAENDYYIWHVDGAINIPYQNLVYNFQNILDKKNKYYFYCKKGNKSRRIVSILEIYGYDATQVLI